MKKFFLSVIFLFATAYSQGQYAVYLSLTFDSSETGSRIFFDGSTCYFNASSFLYIDTIDYPNNQWQVGKPQKALFNSAFSSPNALVTDTANACRPNDTSVCILKIPRNIWSGFQDFSFVYKLDIDSGDIALMEWSADTGLHWTNALTDTNGLFSFYEMPGDSAPSLAHSNVQWDTMALGPSSYLWFSSPADTFLIRFTLITDSSTVPRDGWMMDNFIMGYAGEGIVTIVPNTVSVFLYPNPVANILYLQATEKIRTVSICDVLGNNRFKNMYDSNSVQIDVANLPPGLYFLKVNDQVTKKFTRQ
jgi:hypothetical protein